MKIFRNDFRTVFRKWLIPWLGILLMTAAAGCTERRSDIPDPSEKFTVSGEEKTRELGVYLGEEEVGLLRFGRVYGNWPGEGRVVRLTETISLRLSFRNDRFSISSRQTSYVGENLELIASRGTVDFGAGKWTTKVQKAGDGIYEREQVTTGSRNRDRLNVQKGILTSDTLPLYMEKLQVKENTRLKLGVFNMTLGQEFPVSLVYRGEDRFGRLFSVTYWGMEERIWIDSSGMVVREEMALGVSARIPEGEEPTGHLPLETILSQVMVPGRNIPADIGGRGRITVTLEGSFRPPPEGRWQSVNDSDGVTRVSLIKPIVPPPGKRRPDRNLMPDDAFGLDLDSPRIRELSRNITGSLNDPWDKAVAIGRWVYGELGKSMRECFSALQVLEAGEGECQSHSLLMVSLCRAAGLPSRFAYGVVYLPDRGAYGFHTWVEVYVGDWIPMDPTLGSFPSGVDHLTLAAGGYQDQFRLFPYIVGKGGWRIRYSEQ